MISGSLGGCFVNNHFSLSPPSFFFLFSPPPQQPCFKPQLILVPMSGHYDNKGLPSERGLPGILFWASIKLAEGYEQCREVCFTYGLREKPGAISSSLIGVAKWGLNASSHGITSFHHSDSLSNLWLLHLSSSSSAIFLWRQFNLQQSPHNTIGQLCLPTERR